MLFTWKCTCYHGRGKSQVLSTLKERVSHKDMNAKREGLLRAILESICLHNEPSLTEPAKPCGTQGRQDGSCLWTARQASLAQPSASKSLLLPGCLGKQRSSYDENTTNIIKLVLTPAIISPLDASACLILSEQMCANCVSLQCKYN